MISSLNVSYPWSATVRSRITRKFGFDPLHVFHQDREHFLAPFIEELLLHLVENDGRIGRFVSCGFIAPIEPIITPTFVRIADDFVGRIDLTDLRFGVVLSGLRSGWC